MKYHALFVIYEKVAKFEIVVCMLQIIGGALRVNSIALRMAKRCNRVKTYILV